MVLFGAVSFPDAFPDAHDQKAGLDPCGGFVLASASTLGGSLTAHWRVADAAFVLGSRGARFDRLAAEAECV